MRQRTISAMTMDKRDEIPKPWASGRQIMIIAAIGRNIRRMG
jgi:hypothetical protein